MPGWPFCLMEECFVNFCCMLDDAFKILYAAIPINKVTGFVKNWTEHLVSLFVDSNVQTDDSYIFNDGVASNVSLTQEEVNLSKDIVDVNRKCLHVSYLSSIKCEIQLKPNQKFIVVQS